jgi:mannose-1-phosphate guanylyltransferase
MHAVILAGGVGTRFWPWSRRESPKQLLAIIGSTSMLRQTWERLLPLVPPDRILVVTQAPQRPAVQRELPEIPEANLLVEPAGRNTAPAIGLAATVLHARGATDEAMVVLPADHVVSDADEFRAVLATCEALLQHHDPLLTLGIAPHRAETGYGYIRRGAVAAEVEGREFHRVERFVEKPDADTARRLLADGRHLWNSGMFVWRTGRILDELRRHLPAMGPGLDRLFRAYGTPGWEAQLNTAYGGFPSISIDYAVMEKAAEAWVAAVNIGWSDVGNWASLGELQPHDADGNVLPPGCLAVRAQGNVVEGRGRTIVLLGVSDLIVVDAEDALLVCHREQAQQVGEIPAQLTRLGKESLT